MANEKTNPTADKKDIEDNKITAVLSYLWILCLIPLLGSKNSKFAQFHAKQGFVMLLLSIATIVPFFGHLLGLVLLITAIIAILKTLNGEMWEIPYIYDWSKKINL